MLAWLAQNTLIAAMLAGLVVVLTRVVAPRPAVRHALWLVVLLKLVTPPLVVWPWPVEIALPEPDTAAVVEGHTPAQSGEAAALPPADFMPPDAADQADIASLPGDLADEAGQGFGGLPAEPPPSQAAEQRAAPSVSPALAEAVLGCIWVAGSGLAATVQLFRVARFRRRLGRGRGGPPWLANLVEALASRLGVRPPPVFVVPELGSPSLWSLGRPKLLWPESLLEGLPPRCRASVVAHELAHLKRRDHWVGRLQLVAGWLWWWNPLYWLVCRELSRNAELACDAWVVATLPGERRAYAEALIEVIQWVSRSAAPAPALGMGASRRDVERRLTMIMRGHVPSSVPVKGLVLIGLLALAVLPGWTIGQQSPRNNKQTTPVPTSESEPASYRFEVVEQEPVTATFTTTAEPSDRDKRLEALEKQLQVLLKEVQSLRGGKPTTSTAQTAPAAPKATTNFQPTVVTGTTLWQATPSGTLTVQLAGERAQEVALSRTTYKLPKEKAEALATFLREHVKSAVLETKVDGDSFIVTTTPDNQRTIGQFIAFVQGKSVAGQPAFYQYRAK